LHFIDEDIYLYIYKVRINYLYIQISLIIVRAAIRFLDLP